MQNHHRNLAESITWLSTNTLLPKFAQTWLETLLGTGRVIRRLPLGEGGKYSRSEI